MCKRWDIPIKIHFEKPGFLSEHIFMTRGEKPEFFYERLI
ncbi:Uncharacterized protein dnm_099970 [Desulfonema magnum]|uniref:Uncharacterized protein n=1 Tax=Desulfonema magnum TaxID=45655 RepID=A0A975BY15_9BACT|nr:Uncharacterized protein dnm_099970 [Desulfonema magnum]